MREKKKNKKVIVISIVVAIAILAIVAITVCILVNTQQLKLYNTTIELGQENYTEEIIKADNVYVKEGYTYTVKDNKIDIKNVGSYDLTFEIKGEGKTIEEIKKIQVVDTTPPTVELKQDTFYIGDNINVEEIVKIQDLSQEGEIAYNEANAKIEGQFDTSKEGESKVTINVTDKNGNTGTQELKIKVKNPVMSIYDYIVGQVNASDSYTDYSIDTSNDKFTIKYKNGSVKQGWINYTDKIYYSYLSTGSFVFTDIAYFNNSYKITKLVSTDSWGKKSTYTSGSEVKDEQKYLDEELKSQKELLNNKNNKITLIELK